MKTVDFNNLCSMCPGDSTCCKVKTTALLRGAAATHPEAVNQAIQRIQTGLEPDQTVMITPDSNVDPAILGQMKAGGWLVVLIRPRSSLWTMAGIKEMNNVR